MATTYGVDIDVLQSYLPQWSAGASGNPHTTARIERLVAHKAGLVNGYVSAAGYNFGDIGVATTSDAYDLLQGVVTGLCLRPILNGLTYAGDTTAAEDLAAAAEQWLEDFKSNPDILPWSDSTTYPSVWTTSEGLHLDLSTDAVRRRHRFKSWDGVTNDKKFYW